MRSNRRKSKRRNSSRNRCLQAPRNGNSAKLEWQSWKFERSYATVKNKKYEISNREISEFGAKHQVGKEQIGFKLKFYKSCLMAALLFELEAWGKMDKNEMNEMKEVNRKALQRILSLPISTSYISLTLIRLGFLRVVYSGWWGLI